METVVAERIGRTLEESMDLLITAAVSHQFERPELALALEQVESVLPLDDETHALTRMMADKLKLVLSEHNIQIQMKPHATLLLS